MKFLQVFLIINSILFNIEEKKYFEFTTQKTNGKIDFKFTKQKKKQMVRG